MKSNLKKTGLFLFSIFTFFQMTEAYALCNYVLNVPVMDYTYGETNPSASNTFSIYRHGGSDNNCLDFFVAPTAGWANNYNREAKNLSNGQIIYYNIYKFSNLTGILKGVNHITSPNEAFIDTILNKETKNYTYYFALSTNNNNTPLSPGVYVDFVQFQAYSGTYSNIKGYEGMVDLAVRIYVNKYIALSLVDTGGSFDETKTSKVLDFGELEEGEEQRFDIRVVSNAGYILKASSTNNGSLVRIGSTGEAKSKIEYAFYANNNKISLGISATNPATLSSLYSKTPAGGTQVPIRVVIKDTIDKDPGSYQDYITLSVISTL